MIDDVTMDILIKGNFKFWVLKTAPIDMLPDAIQVAVIAALEGKSPTSAFNHYVKEEKKYRNRHKTNAKAQNI